MLLPAPHLFFSVAADENTYPGSRAAFGGPGDWTWEESAFIVRPSRGKKKMEEWVDGVWPRERMGHGRYGKWPPRTQASCMHSSQRGTSLPH